MLYRAFFPYLFLVTGINNRAGFIAKATRPNYQKESGEIFYYKDTPIIDSYRSYKILCMNIRQLK